MRDILFRAKLKDTNYWAEGFYCSMRETTYCCEEDYKSNTECQCHRSEADLLQKQQHPGRTDRAVHSPGIGLQRIILVCSRKYEYPDQGRQHNR